MGGIREKHSDKFTGGDIPPSPVRGGDDVKIAFLPVLTDKDSHSQPSLISAAHVLRSILSS